MLNYIVKNTFCLQFFNQLVSIKVSKPRIFCNSSLNRVKELVFLQMVFNRSFNLFHLRTRGFLLVHFEFKKNYINIRDGGFGVLGESEN